MMPLFEQKTSIVPLSSFFALGKSDLPLTEEQKKLVHQLNERVSSGQLKVEQARCLCGSDTFELVAQVDCHGIYSPTQLCKSCGIMVSSPRLTEKGYAEFYGQDLYRRIYEVDHHKEAQRKMSNPNKEIFEQVNRQHPVHSKTEVLEIGSGGGWNLIPFKNAGAEVTGLDYSQDLVKLGTAAGMTMLQGGLEQLSKKYDVIILNHVLEHFLDPITELKKIMTHLKPDGVFYIAVPNLLRFSRSQIQNAHTYYFTPRTFRHLGKLVGLKELDFGVAENFHMYAIYTHSNKSIATAKIPSDYRLMKRTLRFYYLKQKVKAFLKR
ncbi:MAG: methyltransferase domain-containing protein [Bdellovibrionales bacterium]